MKPSPKDEARRWLKQVMDAGKVLDQYYIPTRYPDALAFPGVPYETYTERQAQEAVQLARTIVSLVQKKVGLPSSV